jgi:hypothetical protein
MPDSEIARELKSDVAETIKPTDAETSDEVSESSRS